MLLSASFSLKTKFIDDDFVSRIKNRTLTVNNPYSRITLHRKTDQLLFVGDLSLAMSNLRAGTMSAELKGSEAIFTINGIFEINLKSQYVDFAMDPSTIWIVADCTAGKAPVKGLYDGNVKPISGIKDVFYRRDYYNDEVHYPAFEIKVFKTLKEAKSSFATS